MPHCHSEVIIYHGGKELIKDNFVEWGFNKIETQVELQIQLMICHYIIAITQLKPSLFWYLHDKFSVEIDFIVIFTNYW